MSLLFSEREWQLLLEKGDDYTEYPMQKEQDRLMGHWNRTVLWKGGPVCLTSCADLNIENLQVAADDDEDWDCDGTIGRESAHCFGMKQKLLTCRKSV